MSSAQFGDGIGPGNSDESNSFPHESIPRDLQVDSVSKAGISRGEEKGKDRDMAAPVQYPSEIPLALEIPQLSEELLVRGVLPKHLSTLEYDRGKLEVGHVHFGPGGFFKGLIAPLSHRFMQAKIEGWEQWGIATVSFRSPPKALLAQDGLYVHQRKGTYGEDYRIIGSIKQVLSLEEQAQEVMQLLTDPKVRIVTLTISEDGYGINSDGRLQRGHPSVEGDLSNPEAPRFPIGTLVRALELRAEKGIPLFTVLSCDNMPPSGEKTQRAVVDFASLVGKGDLADLLQMHGRFPNTMVDRITPRMTEEGLTEIRSVLGCRDEAAIVTERYCSLVIETGTKRGDNYFPQGRPPWLIGEDGVHLTHDATPWGSMKARLVNSTHLAIAWFGSWSGCEFVHELVSDTNLRPLLRGIMTEELPASFMKPAEVDLDAYVDLTLDRFSNDRLPDSINRLNNDGIRKIRERILPAIRDGLESGTPIKGLTLVVASWLLCRHGFNERDQPIKPAPVERAENLERLEYSSVEALRRDRAIFGYDLPENPRFQAALSDALDKLRQMPLRQIAKLYYPDKSQKQEA